MAYAAGTPGVFGTATSVGATQGFTPASTGAAAVAPTFDNSGKEMLGKGLGKMFDLQQQKEKNSNVPTYSRIDETTGLLVYKDNPKLSAKFGRPDLPEGSAYESDMKMHTEIFNHNKNITDLAAEKVRVAEAEAKAKKEKDDSAFDKEAPLDGKVSSVAAAAADLTPETYAALKATTDVDAGDMASFGVDSEGNKIRGISSMVDYIDDALTTTMPLWQTFSTNSLVPEWLKGDADYAIGEINDSATFFWRNGLDNYFDPMKRAKDPALQTEWLSLQGADGDYDQGKYFDWFIANSGKLEIPGNRYPGKKIGDYNTDIFKQ